MPGLVFLAILLGVAIWVTNAACRRRIRSRQQPSYWLAIFGASSAVLVLVLVIFNRALFTSRFWDEVWNDDRLPAVIFVPFFLFITMILGLFPAALIVRHHREEFKNQASKHDA